MSTKLPPPPPPMVYAHVLEHPRHRGKVTPETWFTALLALQETRQARASMRDVWDWEQAGCPDPSEEEKGAPLPLDPLVCPGCEVSFVPSNNRQVYCTKECRIRRNRNRQSQPVFITCANPECGVGFERINSKQRYCCGSCNDRDRYLLKKAAGGAS